MTMEILEWAYTNNYNNFDEWYRLVKNKENVYPYNRIPYEEWVRDYVSNIECRDEEEVKELLRIILRPYTRKLDIDNYEMYEKLLYKCNNSDNNDNIKEFIDNYTKIERNLRVINGEEAWEGLTWVLQLLPYKPYKAIKALDSYLSAELMYMSDDRIIAINQCIEIIEAKFIKTNNGLENYIMNLKPREFELLIARLYEQLNYKVEITPATRDGGKDIIARIMREDGPEVVYVECKLYKTTNLTNETVRALLGTIYKDNINRGVIFCTGYVSGKLRELDNRIQIWTIEEIIVLLNAHLGSDWYKRLTFLINN